MKKRWPILLLVVLSLSFFIPYLTRGRGFLYGDNLTQRLPNYIFWKQEVASGRLPLWNPYILGGIPFLADLSNNAFALTNLAYLLFPIPVAMTLLTVFYVCLASVTTYWYAKLLTGSRVAALVSAVAFGFSGTLIAAVNDINSLQGIALIPLVFFTLERFLRKPGRVSAVWFIGVLCLQFLSSHPQYSFYTWMALLPYFLIFYRSPGKRAWRSLLAIVGIFLALVAVQLLPFLELSANSFRPQGIEFSSQNQLKLIELPRLIMARFYGSWRNGSSWGPGSQLETGMANTEGYMGLFPLALAIYAALKVHSKASRFWMVAALVALLVSLGSQTPILAALKALLPFYGKLRSPIRMLSVYSFAVAILAGLGTAQLERRKG